MEELVRLLDQTYCIKKRVKYSPPQGFFTRMWNWFREPDNLLDPDDLEDIEKKEQELCSQLIELAKKTKIDIWKGSVMRLIQVERDVKFKITKEEEAIERISNKEKFNDLRESACWEIYGYDSEFDHFIEYIYLKKESCYHFSTLYNKIRNIIREIRAGYRTNDKRDVGYAHLVYILVRVFVQMQPDEYVLVF